MHCMKSARRRKLTPNVKNDKDRTVTSRKYVKKIFDEFYSKLDDENRFGEGSARVSMFLGTSIRQAVMT